MGNRAVIIDKDAYYDRYPTVGIYVHWYDKDDLLGWLKTCRERGYRSTTADLSYGMARLCEIACEDYHTDGYNIGLMVIDPVRDTPKNMLLDVGFVLVSNHEIVEVIE